MEGERCPHGFVEFPCVDCLVRQRDDSDYRAQRAVERQTALEERVIELEQRLKDRSGIEVDPTDLWHFLIESVRYSMGRASTAPSTTCAALRRYGKYLLPPQRRQIRSEIATELRIRENAGRFLGHKCDHDTWQEMVAWLDANP